MVSAAALCGVAAVVMALLCVAAVEAKTLPNELMPGAKPFTIYPGIGRYSYHAVSVTWTEAHEACLDENGHLAIIDSDEEAEVLLEIMTMNNNNDVIHIGYHDLFAEGKFLSVRGQVLEKLGYQKWLAGKPDGGTTKSYCGYKNVGRDNATGLYDEANNVTARFICELPMWDDYDLIPGQGYYKLHSELSTWKDSLETCRSEGAYLLLFTSTAERDLVVDKYMGVSLAYVWYGAHHMFTNQRFVTIFDEPLAKSGFNAWENGYPGGLPNKQYPYVALNVFPGKPHDLLLFPTSDQLPFICKHDLHDRA